MHISKWTDPNPPQPMYFFCSQYSFSDDPRATWFRTVWRTQVGDSKKVVCSLAFWTVRVTVSAFDFAVSLFAISYSITSSANALDVSSESLPFGC